MIRIKARGAVGATLHPTIAEHAMRTLIAYYSMTGNSRALAREIADAFPGADVEEIRERWPRRGLVGAARALADALLRREPRIEPPVHDPRDYDLVLMGGPIWAGRMAAPVRAFAGRYGPRPRRVGYFCTQGGSSTRVAFADLDAKCGRPAQATLVVDAMHLPAALHADALQRFVAELA